MSRITTHVLDTALGAPGARVAVTLLRREANATLELARAVTDSDGRVRDFAIPSLVAGTYQLSFDTAGYFGASGRSAFFERVLIEFTVHDPSQHYHVPLLLSPFGYTTYRGS